MTDKAPAPKLYYTIKETAAELELTQQKIFNLLRSDNNPFPGAARMGWQWAIPVEDVQTYKQSLTNTK